MALRRSRPKTGVQTMLHVADRFLVGKLHILDYRLGKQYARSVGQFLRARRNHRPRNRDRSNDQQLGRRQFFTRMPAVRPSQSVDAFLTP